MHRFPRVVIAAIERLAVIAVQHAADAGTQVRQLPRQRTQRFRLRGWEHRRGIGPVVAFHLKLGRARSGRDFIRI